MVRASVAVPSLMSTASVGLLWTVWHCSPSTLRPPLPWVVLGRPLVSLPGGRRSVFEWIRPASRERPIYLSGLVVGLSRSRCIRITRPVRAAHPWVTHCLPPVPAVLLSFFAEFKDSFLDIMSMIGGGESTGGSVNHRVVGSSSPFVAAFLGDSLRCPCRRARSCGSWSRNAI